MWAGLNHAIKTFGGNTVHFFDRFNLVSIYTEGPTTVHPGKVVNSKARKVRSPNQHFHS